MLPYFKLLKNISALAQAAKSGSLIDFKRVLRTSEDDIHRTDGVIAAKYLIVYYLCTFILHLCTYLIVFRRLDT